jgi:lipopolysaccharide heptosyltransferase II
MADQKKYQNVLCIRADNMGDVIMASPAFRALKETFGSRITLLTSKAGAIVAPHIACIDDVVTFDLPWVQNTGSEPAELLVLAEKLRKMNFDATIIFTVYSQSSLPAAMLTYMAGIPVRVAYARENPYQLLTHWLPDVEPYERIVHQVERDLTLAAHIGANTQDDRLQLRITPDEEDTCAQKLSDAGFANGQPYIVFHPGVSEAKRKYPAGHWIEAGRQLAEKYNLPILVSGSKSEKSLAETIAEGIGTSAVSVAGECTLGEFIVLIKNAFCVISVNTATIHIAAAMQTPTVVLYAQTNPQHTPWRNAHQIIPFSVPEDLKSRNTIIRYVSDQLYTDQVPYPDPMQIVSAIENLVPVTDFAASALIRY